MISRLVVLALLSVTAVGAQTPARDTLELARLQQTAVDRDPRGRQLALLEAQSALRQRNIDAERRPTLSIESQAQHQSDVARIPITLPGGQSPPLPPHDTYDARLAAQQRLYDPSVAARRAVEDAQLADAQARLRTALYPLRQSVNESFFAALRAQTQLAELETSITDIEAQLRVAEPRVREGAALPSEVNALRAELLRRRQLVAEANANRRASLTVLAELTGQSLDSAVRLTEPALDSTVTRVRQVYADLRSRPEYEQFARSRELLQRQEAARGAQDKPRVSAFGRVGYGRPGLNPLDNKFDSYWLAGVQLQWSPWSWGATDRDREVLEIQRQILLTEEAAFTDNLRRAVAQDVATIDRLASALRTDDEIIALREDIAAETRARYTESVITSAEYVDKQTDVLSARIARALHRVELAQARAHYLTTLGIEAR